jgi:RNA polymerase sigma-70 factor, ECF subfamily
MREWQGVRPGLVVRFDGQPGRWLGLPAVGRIGQAIEGSSDRADDGDEALIMAIVAGDRGALARLYDRYAPLLLAVGQRMLRNRREAEDLVQDVFLEAWRRAADYNRARGSVRAWLLVRLRSRALDRLRAASGSPVSQVSPARLEEPAAQGEDPSLAPDRAAVRRALETLSSEQRAVLELGYFEGLSSSEIALRTGAPIGTVKSRVATALARLRAGLKLDGTEGGAP